MIYQILPFLLLPLNVVNAVVILEGCDSSLTNAIAECPVAYTNLCCNHVLLTNQSNPLTQFNSCLSYGDLGCKAGFYTAGNLTKRCPTGFFCKEGIRCVIPCTSGGYCPGYIKDTKNNKSCTRENSESKESVLLNGVYICPGESEESACEEGYYCSDPKTKSTCPDGRVCNKGSSRPYRCNLFKGCAFFTDAGFEDVVGLFLILLLIIAFVLYYFLISKKHSNISQVIHKRTGIQTTGFAKFKKSFNIQHALSETTEVDINGYREKLPKHPTHITIKVENVSFKLPNGHRILRNVNVEFKHSHLNVVMGPSGCGKSTLLNLLMGLKNKGTESGHIILNDNHVHSLAEYRKYIGYVTQDDVMHENLTVKEILTYQAQLRLSRDYDNTYICESVDEVIDLLGLNRVSDNIVGGSEKNGISGGQRRRVSIGMELVTNPTVLLLDEPTSGLDSATSLSVITLLRKLSTQVGINVITTIHQPRIELFSLFHNITLISNGGRIAYNCNSDNIKGYFENLGYIFPSSSNPADIIIDIVAGLLVSSQCSSNDLPKLWSEELEKRTIDDNNLTNGALPENLTIMKRPWYDQCLTMFHRETVLRSRVFTQMIKESAMAFTLGIMLSVLFREGIYNLLNPAVNLQALAVGLLGVTNALKTFGGDRLIFLREARSGINVFSYFMANILEAIPFICVVMPISFVGIFWTGADAKASFGFYYFLIMLTTFTTSGFGYFISVTVGPKSTSLVSVSFILACSMFAGCTLTICELEEIKVIGPILFNLSYGKWFVQAILISEYKQMSDIYGYKYIVNTARNKYTSGDELVAIWVLLAMGIGIRILTLLALYWDKSNLNFSELCFYSISRCYNDDDNVDCLVLQNTKKEKTFSNDIM